ncbi:unnamed protein product [Eruca vesicaria subsp. sativa]|uniref:Uncharacterized protein n=1 Tax=Eruca vesicaria subsp. sativa TaxID=29727 RepID=A0ABC8KET3_ERUVS|nr:unnamed protein product [Eruca vesicaria subsp. sativa]
MNSRVALTYGMSLESESCYLGRRPVLETDAYQQLKDDCLSLKSELLKEVAGYEDDSNSRGWAKSQSVWAQVSDSGGDTSSRHVRQRTT